MKTKLEITLDEDTTLEDINELGNELKKVIDSSDKFKAMITDIKLSGKI